jgi:hypothetical protein
LSVSDAPTPPSLARRAVAVLVGLFATWQLVFLPAANVIDFVPRRVGPPLEPVGDHYQKRGTFTDVEPLQAAADGAGTALDLWAEASGQDQGWPLFTPGVPPYSVIPAVEFRFADGPPETLLSRFEPADKFAPPLRPAMLNNRLFNAESQLMFLVWYAPPEEVARRFAPPEEVARLSGAYRELPDAARAWQAFIRAYLAWRLKEYVAANPGRMPAEVVLKYRFIPTPRPGEPGGWTGPVSERPFARWRPADDTYEAFDVLTGRFVPVGGAP